MGLVWTVATASTVATNADAIGYTEEHWSPTKFRDSGTDHRLDTGSHGR